MRTRQDFIVRYETKLKNNASVESLDKTTGKPVAEVREIPGNLTSVNANLLDNNYPVMTSG